MPVCSPAPTSLVMPTPFTVSACVVLTEEGRVCGDGLLKIAEVVEIVPFVEMCTYITTCFQRCIIVQVTTSMWVSCWN